MVKKVNLFYILLLLFSYSLNAQIQRGGEPLSKNATYLSFADVPVEVMPSFDLVKMLEEDKLYNVKGSPYRFGKEFEVELNLNANGIWQTLPNGDRIWRIAIESKGAKTMNFQFDDFFIPNGASLFIYNKKYQNVLGAFTSENNKPYGKFSTTVIEGEIIYFEYYEPKAVERKGTINFYKVVHGYRDYRNNFKQYGDSGSCNVNVACEEGSDWQDQANSIGMILNGGARHCSGVLLNNIREDGIPYFLTANHCSNVSDITLWTFMFNYQSSGCENSDGPTNMTVSGATLKAFNPASDFYLIELSSPIPASYNAFYSGWDNREVQPQQAVCIHHPTGDIKKISFENDPLLSVDAENIGEETYWEVTDWDLGTTEGGSSGSPIFNSEKRVVGQLLGGDAACDNDDYDVFGKVSKSWGSSNNYSGSLQPWLSPDDSTIETFNGTYLNDVLSELDASIFLVENFPTLLCESGINLPNLIIKNTGKNILSSAKIIWQLDGEEPVEFGWAGNLEALKTNIIDLPTVSVNVGAHLLSIEIVEINGATNIDNDKLLIPFEVIDNGQTLQLTINADQYGSETSFELVNTFGDIIISGSNLVPSAANLYGACLPSGCYDFNISDSFGDGICCSFGDGSYNLVLSADGEIINNTGSFGDGESTSFCVNAEGLPPQITDVNVSEAKFCIGGETQLSFTSNSFMFANWSFEPPLIEETNVNSPIISVNEAGVYTATLRLTNGLGTSQKQIIFEVFDYPEYTITITDNTIANFAGAINLTINDSTQIFWNDGYTSTTRTNLSEGIYDFTLIGEGGCVLTDSVEVNVSYNYPIYPNPVVNDILNIYNPSKDAANVIIYNLIGEKVIEFNVQNGRNQFDISGFSSGLYFVNYMFGDEVYKEKLVVD